MTHWLKEYIVYDHFLPRPDWGRISERTEKDFSAIDQNQLWNDIARGWLDAVIEKLPNGYSYSETENFIVLNKANDRYVELFQGFLERCLGRLLRIMKGVAKDDGYGKHVVMIFEDVDTYYSYISCFGPQEGEYGLSSGMYLNYGYGHFVFPHQNLDFVEPLAAHEMTHALLSHLDLPLWLNEGMAVNMEAMITGLGPPRLTKEAYEKHALFWDEKEIQEFWMGISFGRPDEGQELSYQLAQILVTNLSEDYERFVEFTNKAMFSDGGESAAEEIYKVSLGSLIEGFLGAGEWWPTPEAWPPQPDLT